MACLINDFPRCRIDENLSIEIRSEAHNYGNWQITKSWKIEYEGQSMLSCNEPCMNLILSATFTDNGLVWQTVPTFVWSMPLHQNESVGRYQDLRGDSPFPEILQSPAAEVRTIGSNSKGPYDNSFLHGYRLITDDQNNKWQPPKDDFYSELGFVNPHQSRPRKLENGEAIPSYENQLFDFAEKHSQDTHSHSSEEDFKPQRCICCGVHTNYVTVLIVNESGSFCAECWADIFGKKQDAIGKVYSRDYDEEDDSYEDWVYKMPINSSRLDLIFKYH
jgi:hypothetical protein